MTEKFTIGHKTRASSNLHEYSVSELSDALKSTIEDGFALVRVRGELGRVSTPASGHVYLDLKDDRAVLNGVIWKGMAARLKIKPEQGMEVVATGRMTTFAGQSRYQIIIDTLEPAGAGALMALYEKRKKRLEAEGLFAEDRKRALPFIPSVIGVATSPSGAVIRDILHRLRARFPVHVLVWPTPVQGKGAETKIAAAIDGFNALAPGGPVPRPDLLIVARGGGSLKDLWCFNEEAVARAAANSTIPLISAVGHETDTTLIDYVADRRAPTPTAAAEMATPVRSDLAAELVNKQRRLMDGQLRLLAERRAALTAATRGLGRPEDILGTNGQRLDRLSDLLVGGLRRRIDSARARTARAQGRLTPTILKSGFAARADRLARGGEKMTASLTHSLARRRDRVRHARLGRKTLIRQATDHRRRLDELATRSRATGRSLLERKQTTLSGLEKVLASLSHRSVLARGFALVRDETGMLARTARALTPGRTGSVEFTDGVRTVTFGAPGDSPHGEAPTATGAALGPKKRRARPKTGTQSSLFD
ncbi:MAG: exodeoxyribonuclease VII large subunit [Pseudomonadota bacterium]